MDLFHPLASKPHQHALAGMMESITGLTNRHPTHPPMLFLPKQAFPPLNSSNGFFKRDYISGLLQKGKDKHTMYLDAMIPASNDGFFQKPAAAAS